MRCGHNVAAAWLALLLALAPAPSSWARTLTDSAGRTVGLPERVERVFAAGPPAAIILYTLAPDRLIGWPRALRPEEAEHLRPEAAGLPEVGRLTGRGDTANVEVVLAHRPDLIFDYGTVAPTYRSLADRVQGQTGIPYALIDGRFDAIPAAYRLLGRMLGMEERAERLARYAEAVVAERDAVLARVPADDYPRVYYARGPQGLETGLGGSINVELIEQAGAINVAAEAGRGSLATVSMERILGWNPPVILTLDRNVFQTIRTDPRWAGIDAVRNGRVHRAPTEPFGWIDFPPSVNRLLGVMWLTRLLHPDQAPGDLRARTREFHALFYGREPTDAQLDRLLDGALPAGR